MPISRDRDCYGLAENSEISGGCQVFGLRQRFDHFEHGGRVQTAGTVREESPRGAPSSLGVYMYAIQHISKEENETISGTREKSTVADSAEPKQ
jgi:hypothetical protein